MPAPDWAAAGMLDAGNCPACWSPMGRDRRVELARTRAADTARAAEPPPACPALPVVFHAGCAPSGWEVLAGPVTLDYALRARARMLDSRER